MIRDAMLSRGCVFSLQKRVDVQCACMFRGRVVVAEIRKMKRSGMNAVSLMSRQFSRPHHMILKNLIKMSLYFNAVPFHISMLKKSSFFHNNMNSRNTKDSS